MMLRFFALMCACLLAANVQAAGFGDPEVDVARRLVEVTYKQDVAANDPRVAKVRVQVAQASKATGETEQGVAQACMRNARYIFDVTKVYVSPLDVLDAVAMHAPAGKPLSATTQRYVELRTRMKLDHAGAMAGFAKTN